MEFSEFEVLNLTDIYFNNTVIEDHFHNITENLMVQIFFYFVYAIIFILGVSGNSLVCVVVLRNRNIHTVTNFFIINLAVADILLCILPLPLMSTFTFMSKWVFGTAICHLLPLSQEVSIFVTSLTLIAITVNQGRLRLLTSVFIICGIWIFSILVALPYGIFMQTFQEYNYDNEYQTYCYENWPTVIARLAFGYSSLVLQFVIPFVIIAIKYLMVAIKQRGDVESSSKEELDRERKTNCMLMTMVIIFVCTWFPLNAYYSVQNFSTIIHWDTAALIYVIAHSIAMSSVCFYPFLYAWFIPEFCQEFKMVMFCFCLKKLHNGNKTSVPTSKSANESADLTCVVSYSATTDNIEVKMTEIPLME